MIIRRIFYSWQFVAVAVLPLWLLIGSAIFGTGGWAVLGVFFGAVALGLSLLVVALLVYARKEVRSSRTVSWADVGVMTLWHGLIIGIGFAESASGWLSVLVVFVGMGAFWFALWELYDAARKRMRAIACSRTRGMRHPEASDRRRRARTSSRSNECVLDLAG